MLLCYVTDRHLLGRDASCAELLRSIRTAIRAGVDWVQIREKDLSPKALFDLARQSVEFAASETRASRDSSSKIIVNDRLDVALAAGAGGVHLGGASIEVAAVARWRDAGNLPRDFLIGASCHSAAEALTAQEGGADYVFLGPIFDTPSKMKFGAPLGPAALADAAQHVKIPVLAIGGMNENNARSCREAAAAGIAAIRLFQSSETESLAEKIAALRAVS